MLFFKIFYERYLRASKEEPYWALPAIFLHALIKCGDEIGAFDCHADRAVAKVIDADVWTAAASGAKDPRAGRAPKEARVARSAMEANGSLPQLGQGRQMCSR